MPAPEIPVIRFNSRRDIPKFGVSCRCGDRVSLHQAAKNLLPYVDTPFIM